MPPTCIWFSYLLNGIDFHFHLYITGTPANLINRLVSFDLLISKYVHRLLMRWASILPIMAFQGLSVLELDRGT